MPQWGKNDQANNSVLWGPAAVKTAANTANRDALFGNTTPDAFITGMTTGQFGVDVTEQEVARVTGSPRPTHAGWVLRKEGSGGRAGRVQMETLVAMGSITGDAADDAVFADVAIFITTQPVSASGEAAEDDVVTFTVVGETVPEGETITYQWEADTGTGFANVTNDSTYSGTTTDTLSVNANTAANADIRVVLSSTGGDSVTSDVVTLTIT